MSHTSRVPGDTSGATVLAGYPGQEIVARQNTYTNFFGGSNFGDVTSITLTPGTWVINAHMTVYLNFSTMQTWGGFIGTVAGNNSTGRVDGDNAFYGAVPTSSMNFETRSVSGYMVRISSNTTYYLKAFAGYSAGTPQFVGRISGFRIA